MSKITVFVGRHPGVVFKAFHESLLQRGDYVEEIHVVVDHPLLLGLVQSLVESHIQFMGEELSIRVTTEFPSELGEYVVVDYASRQAAKVGMIAERQEIPLFVALKDETKARPGSWEEETNDLSKLVGLTSDKRRDFLNGFYFRLEQLR